VAVVGLSGDPSRPSCRVADYLRDHGYKIIPVNPKEKVLMGETSYPNLSAIPEPVDVVDIFRRSEDVMPIVEEAIKIKAGTVWMQEGIINEAAADKARQAGLKVVMDKCMRKELMKMHEQEKG
jgi:predicted CoA-binding protein